MKIEVDRKDLICLLNGIKPDFDSMVELEARNIGRFSSQGWWWNPDIINDMTEEQIFVLYAQCKKSLK